MQGKDYYNILDVSRNASDAEIRKAYRNLAQKYHPDRNKGNKRAEEKFKEVLEAYQVLSNKEKRTQYDMMREGFNPFAERWGGFRSTGKGAEGFSFEDQGGFGGLGDIFENIFGGGRARASHRSTRHRSTRGNNVRTSITLPFDMAINGGKQTIRVSKNSICSNCGGTGAQPGTKTRSCPE